MAYIPGGNWGECDRCGFAYRQGLGDLVMEWTGLVVCYPCLDPVPPEMFPPDIYPEGLAVPNPRPFQGQDDFLQDETQLPVTGAALPSPGGSGTVSPLYFEDSPEEPLAPDDVDSDHYFRTGPVGS